MTHRDRAGDPSGQGAGRRGAAGDVGQRQGFPTPQGSPLPVRPRDRRRLPKVFGRRRARLAVPAPPRHALLAERLWPKDWGKPSLWVIINAPWYNANYRGVPGAGSSLFGDQRADPGLDLPGDRTGRVIRNGYPPYPRRLFPPYDFAAPHLVQTALFLRVYGRRDLWRRPLNRSWFVPISSALSSKTRAGPPAGQGLHERPSGRPGEEPPKKEGHIGRRSKIP